MPRLLPLVLPTLTACSNAPADDAGMIADAPERPDAGVDGGARCTGLDGETTCGSGDEVRTCCRGYVSVSYDGPCMRRLDAGTIGDAGSPCDVEPTWPGCPCTGEGALHCEIAGWRRVCRSGVWVEETGFVCC